MKDETGESSEEPVRLQHQPSIITGTMRSYQLEALNWMISLHNNNINGILADEMGLGKTLETIALLGYLKEYKGINGPFLIIVPKSTMTNWDKECKRWCPSLTRLVFHGDKETRGPLKEQVGQTDVCITTYEMSLIEKGTFRKPKWEYVIIDEAHRVKNENSSLSLVVRSFASKHRLLITGTPLQNNLHELWALLNFLVPDVFDSSADFEAWFDVTNEEGRDTIATRLHKILKPFLLRRLKSDVAKDLPPKVETKLFVGLSAMQRAWYTKILSRDMAVLNGTGTGKMRLLNIVMQLRKITNHPYLFAGAEPGPPFFEGEHLIENSGKMVLLDKLLKKLKAQGSRVLIFSQMTRLLDILEDYCHYRGFKYCRIDGSTKQVDRDDSMDVFNAPGSEKFIFLLSTRAGGLGINLQTADTVILYDSDWNPQMDLQAQDRAHRIGQTKIVHVYRFVTEGTIEEKITERALQKLYLDAVVIKQGRLADKDKNLSAKDLQAMVRFGANRIFQSKEATITDEDIDAIISRGTSKTEEETAKLKAASNNNLLNFSISTDDTSVYEFQGEDFNRDKKKPFGGLVFIEPPKRERKKNYDINAYYRDAMQASDKQKKVRVFKPTPRFDFQFFNVERLEELERKEWESKHNLKALKEQAKAIEREARKRAAEEEREKKRLEKIARAMELRRQGAEEEEDDDDEEEDNSDNQSAAPEASPSSPVSPASDQMDESEDTAVKEEKVKEEDAEEVKVEKRRSSRNSLTKSPPKDEQKGTSKTKEEVDEHEAKQKELENAAGCLTEDEQAEKVRRMDQNLP